MSKTSDYRTDDQDNLAARPGADLRLRLLTLKDLAHAFLEELGTVGEIEATDPADSPIDFYDEVRRFEIELIQSALRRTNGVQTEAASLINLKPSTLHAKIKQYQLNAADFTPRAAAASQEQSPYDDDETRGRAGGGGEGAGEESEENVPVLA